MFLATALRGSGMSGKHTAQLLFLHARHLWVQFTGKNVHSDYHDTKLHMRYQNPIRDLIVTLAVSNLQVIWLSRDVALDISSFFHTNPTCLGFVRTTVYTFDFKTQVDDKNIMYYLRGIITLYLLSV